MTAPHSRPGRTSGEKHGHVPIPRTTCRALASGVWPPASTASRRAPECTSSFAAGCPDAGLVG